MNLAAYSVVFDVYAKYFRQIVSNWINYPSGAFVAEPKTEETFNRVYEEFLKQHDIRVPEVDLERQLVSERSEIWTKGDPGFEEVLARNGLYVLNGPVFRVLSRFVEQPTNWKLAEVAERISIVPTLLAKVSLAVDRAFTKNDNPLEKGIYFYPSVQFCFSRDRCLRYGAGDAESNKKFALELLRNRNLIEFLFEVQLGSGKKHRLPIDVFSKFRMVSNLLGDCLRSCRSPVSIESVNKLSLLCLIEISLLNLLDDVSESSAELDCIGEYPNDSSDDSDEIVDGFFGLTGYYGLSSSVLLRMLLLSRMLADVLSGSGFVIDGMLTNYEFYLDRNYNSAGEIPDEADKFTLNDLLSGYSSYPVLFDYPVFLGPEVSALSDNREYLDALDVKEGRLPVLVYVLMSSKAERLFGLLIFPITFGSSFLSPIFCTFDPDLVVGDFLRKLADGVDKFVSNMNIYQNLVDETSGSDVIGQNFKKTYSFYHRSLAADCVWAFLNLCLCLRSGKGKFVKRSVKVWDHDLVALAGPIGGISGN